MASWLVVVVVVVAWRMAWLTVSAPLVCVGVEAQTELWSVLVGVVVVVGVGWPNVK